MRISLTALLLAFLGILAPSRGFSDCKMEIEQLLSRTSSAPRLDIKTRERFTSMIRSHAGLILDEKVKEIGSERQYTEQSPIYISQFEGSKTGSRLELVYEEHAQIVGYRLKKAGSFSYHCSSPDFISAILKAEKQSQKEKKAK